MHNLKNNTNSKKKIRFGILLVVILSGAVIWFNRSYLTAYYYNWRYNDFKTGDKLYPKEDKVKDLSEHSGNMIILSKRVRPLGNKTGRDYVMKCPWAISIDSLLKYKSVCIGSYSDSEIFNLKGEKEYVSMIFFSIIPDKKALIKHSERQLYMPPAGYEFDNGPFYVLPFQVSNKSPLAF